MMARTVLFVALAAAVTAALPAAADTQGAPVVTITPQGAAAPSLDARVTKLERVVEGQALADLMMRIQRLQEDVQKLRGDLEVQSNDLDGIKQRQRDLYLDIDRRLRQLEVASSSTVQAAPAAASPPAAVPVMPSFGPSAVPAAAAPPNPEQEQAAYQKAFNYLKDGHYDDAIAAFRDMLATYPGGNLSDNAQYWLGEAHFAARRFREARDEFSKVINNYPQSSKVPDAMLKLGFSYYELADWGKARDTLEQLKGRYPQSTAAQLADKRLQKMKAEGH
jgi:tol-pal system protein YbgF